MRITGAFLAERVTAVNNKMNVEGGVISRYSLGPDRIATFNIVLLTQGDTKAADRLIVIKVSPPNGGEPLHLHRELPIDTVDADVAFTTFQFRLPMKVNGRWTVEVSGAVGEVSLPLTVSGPSPGIG